MSFYLQYHNCDKEGFKYLFSDDDRFGIYTRLAHVRKAQGTVFLIVGVGKPRQYFLWETFEIDNVEDQVDGSFHAEGFGFRLCPPQRLEGADFDAFKNSCANFVGFRKIDDLPYCTTLKKLAKQHRSQKPMEAYLQELLGLTKEGTEDHQIIEKQLGWQPSASRPGKQRPAPSDGTSRKNTPKLRPEPRRNGIETEVDSQDALATHSQTEGSLELDGKNVKNLRALSIRQPHAEAIMRGIKKIEFRSRPTQIRGRVQIYASLKRYSADEEAWMLSTAKYGMPDISCDDLPRGVLIGTVEVCDCTEKDGEFNWHLGTPSVRLDC